MKQKTLNKTQKELLNCIFDVLCDNEHAANSLKYIKSKTFEVEYTDKEHAIIKLSNNFILKLQ